MFRIMLCLVLFGCADEEWRMMPEFDAWTLPYIDEQLSRKVKSIVRKSNLHVHIAWKNENKLKNTLTKSAICKPRCPGGQKCNLCMSDFKGDCTRKNIVYKIHCKICQKEGIDATYVGESMRPIRLRYNEHRRDAINRTPNTPLGDHFLREHTHNTATDSDILQLRILYRAQDHPDRKIAESILIRSETPTLNIPGSSWPIIGVVWFLYHPICMYVCMYIDLCVCMCRYLTAPPARRWQDPAPPPAGRPACPPARCGPGRAVPSCRLACF